jgi:hypothetical protein
MDVNVTPFEIETKTRHGNMVRAHVYLPRDRAGPFPVLLGASPYQKSLRHLPAIPATFPFIEYGPMQLRRPRVLLLRRGHYPRAKRSPPSR